MITEIGHYALALAFAVALAQSLVPLHGAHVGRASWMALAGPASQVQFLLVAVAFASLTHAYVVSDFSLVNVARNSHSAKPMLYKITGVWANHEGSMLLWVLILTLFGMLVGTFGRNLPPSLKARVLSVQGMIGAGFLAFILFTSNPFERLPVPPVDGGGMNPLLQDPGVAFHPPFLYLGYVGFSIAFAFAVAALIEGRVDAAWARWVRPWTLLAWSALTMGIAMGSWWAYYELGWGGWWYWDPVENASFMPWLLGTALLHSAIVVEKRDTLKRWTILLAILTFGLSLIGTFLVRSGVLSSVHAFAQDPERGLFILVLLALAIGGALLLYAWRAPALRAGGLFTPVSREGGLLLNNLLMATACATVFLGTLYPLFVDVLGAEKISVGPPYFNATFVPIMIPALVTMALGPMLPWKRGDLAGALQRLRLAFAAAAVTALVTYAVASDGPVLAVLGMAIAVWVLVGTLVEYADRIKLFRAPLRDSARRAANLPRAAYGMTLAHAGMAVLVVGVTGASAWKQESLQMMQVGDSVNLSGYEFSLLDVGQVAGPNYTTRLGTVRVERDGELIAVLFPEKRWYPVQAQETSEAAIHSNGMADLYAVLGEPDETGRWVTRFYRTPLVPWIWAGSLLMVLGGLFSLSDRRLRVGAPRRAAQGSGLAPAPAGG
ncbi:MAG: heme lyase CcmF/NrfE family subunit [Alphaproteobacteria bacterium]|nr:heme lyase CcmF/NrfE family subunit [Alphaproteobacteria bacterium]